MGAVIGMPSAPTDYQHGPPATAPAGFTAYPAGPDARRLVWDALTGTVYDLRYTADATADDAWTEMSMAMSGYVADELEMGTEYTFELRARGMSRAGVGDLHGLDNQTVAKKLRVSPQMVGRWRARFVTRRVDGLLDEPRPGAPRTITDDTVEAVIVRTLETTPDGATHWSTRTMAKATGLSHGTIARIWRAFGLQPHRTKTFTLSPDPLLVEKVRDVVGLYLHPPDHALVLCVDEKSQIQALDRTQPLLPMQPGQTARHTHTYRRHGTTSLFAALDAQSGQVIGRTYRRHRAIEFRKFLDLIEAAVPPNLDVHLILDNYSTHKTPLIHRWLAKRPRFQLHFTPTYSSWLNLVERWFAELTTKQLRRGTHRSVRRLEAAIWEFLDTSNAAGKPFVWTKSADEILASIARFAQRTLVVHN